MTSFKQILVVLAVIQWTEEVSCTPLLHGVKITRSFDVDFKPFQFKPFSYIMEKWGPFGAFGKKYAIAKRDVDTVNITPPPIQTSSVLFTGVSAAGPAVARPAPVNEVTPDNPPPPVKIPPIPITNGIPPSAISNDIFQSSEVIPVAPVNPGIGSEYNSNIPTGLNTDISRIQPFIQNINNQKPVVDNTPLRVNLLVPPQPQPDVANVAMPDGQPAPGNTSRFGAIARLFGEFFLQLLSRIINNARSSFGQLSSRA